MLQTYRFLIGKELNRSKKKKREKKE
jgi:hypothetical protein